METRILVNAVDGVAVTIPGYFRPAQKTRAGCQCAQRWVYQKTASAAPVWLSGTCINPLNDPKGAWCVFEPDSCTTPEGKSICISVDTARPLSSTRDDQPAEVQYAKLSVLPVVKFRPSAVSRLLSNHWYSLLVGYCLPCSCCE